MRITDSGIRLKSFDCAMEEIFFYSFKETQKKCFLNRNLIILLTFFRK